MKDLSNITLAHYKNSTEIVPGITMEDLVKACLIGRLNQYYIGETGEGKTQIESDIMGLFDNRGFFEQGRNDLTVREIFTRLNLQKLREAKTTEDVKEVTGLVKSPVFVVDELPRCIPAAQNQFFNLFDGFVTIRRTVFDRVPRVFRRCRFGELRERKIRGQLRYGSGVAGSDACHRRCGCVPANSC